MAIRILRSVKFVWNFGEMKVESRNVLSMKNRTSLIFMNIVKIRKDIRMVCQWNFSSEICRTE